MGRWHTMRSEGSRQPPKTTFILMLAIGFFLVCLAFWGMDWAMTHQSTGQPVQVMGAEMSPSMWWNIQWVILFIGIIFITYGAIKVGYQSCRGEI